MPDLETIAVVAVNLPHALKRVGYKGPRGGVYRPRLMILHVGWATFTLEIFQVEALGPKSRCRRVMYDRGQLIGDKKQGHPQDYFFEFLRTMNIVGGINAYFGNSSKPYE